MTPEQRDKLMDKLAAAKAAVVDAEVELDDAKERLMDAEWEVGRLERQFPEML